jgi:dipeptide/tripeptide permease
VGRYWALVIGLSIYVIGFTLLTIMASGILCQRSPALPSCVPETYGILICVGIAAGTVRANIPSFGAEQVNTFKSFCFYRSLNDMLIYTIF